MTLSRRQFTALTATSLALAALRRAPAADPMPNPSSAPLPDTFFEIRPLRDNAWAILPPPNVRGVGGNTVLVKGKDALLLIDTKMASVGRWLRIESETLAGAPLRVTHVVNTHHHHDHTAGNSAFMGDVTLYAHEKAIPRIAKSFDRFVASIEGNVAEIARSDRPHKDRVLDEAARVQANIEAGAITADSFAPNRIVKNDTSLDIGGTQGWLRHYGPGHTDNDLVVHFPDLNIVVAGDLLFHEMHPFCDASGGISTTGWQTSLERTMNLCDDNTIVVPGHGNLTTKSALQTQHDYFTKLRQIVEHAKNVEGMSRDEVTNLQTGAFKDLANPERLKMALAVVFDELASKP